MTRLPPPRDDLTGFAPYRTQQMPAAVRIQANEWAEPNPADRYLTAAELSTLLLNRYPSTGAELRETLASRWGTLPEQIIFGNGSNEVLLNTFLAYGGHGRTTLVFEPTYSMHGRLAVIAGGTVAQEQVGLPYLVTRERALAAIARVRPAIVVFCTPNNPTGNRVPADAILATAEAYPETLVLVDEAYSDFAGFSHLGDQPGHPNLVISKTFSKARAAAGLRLGVLVAHPEIASVYRAVQLPYNLSALTLAVATKLARDEGPIAARVVTAARERARLAAALALVPAIEAFPSEANFILFRARDGDAVGTHARFLAEGVLIRDISIWPGCAGCLRVSVGTPPENDAFITALAKVFEGVTA
ncbi:MAG: aminotransferase class I/II-fold pyridoxal phosphate-dependent enzyme [Chloroflexi bacterium]|nr:aminotransferase class I/II-fold pyridoxal phosphate-dependent enzyme [Chloroflexota bacterium]